MSLDEIKEVIIKNKDNIMLCYLDYSNNFIVSRVPLFD